MDEMRAGLIPCVRKVWTKRGIRHMYDYQIKYEWVWVYNVVFPFTGKCFTMFFSTVNKECMKVFWEEFRKEYSDGKYLIVWDGAGFHQEEDYKGLDYISFIKLPAYSPELNPAETLWVKFREYIANECFNDIDALIFELEKAYWYIKNNPDGVKSQTLFHWIENLTNY